jgi:hypothetical protein
MLAHWPTGGKLGFLLLLPERAVSTQVGAQDADTGGEQGERCGRQGKLL